MSGQCSGSVDSKCHELSEMVWFIWYKSLVEIRGDVTYVGQQTREESATQLVICEMLSLAICFNSYSNHNLRSDEPPKNITNNLPKKGSPPIWSS